MVREQVSQPMPSLVDLELISEELELLPLSQARVEQLSSNGPVWTLQERELLPPFRVLVEQLSCLVLTL
jgi:hypothetical protein